MTNQNSNQIKPGNNMFYEIVNRTKLILRLMVDKRVNLLVKFIPIASIAYVIWPIDIPGPLDDLGIFALGMYTFVEFCPKDVVKEHLDLIHGISAGEDPQPGEDIIDAEFKDLDNTDPDKS